MASLGVLLIVFGVGSFVLPFFNIQFELMGWVDPYQPWAGIGVALAGVALVAFARWRASGGAAPPSP